MLTIKMITPQGLYKTTEGKIMNIVTTDGERGILPSHMPMVAMLKISVVSIEETGGREHYAVSGGMFYLDHDNQVTLLSDAIENVKDIDEKRALNAKVKAEENMKTTDGQDYLNAEIALKKALNRLHAIKN
ncbi:MAG: ATP synthase F1 subunit epsilon [Erysipelotrichaceae bacterium]